MRARYVHTNLIARDWRTLADFYVGVFGCEIAPDARGSLEFHMSGTIR